MLSDHLKSFFYIIIMIIMHISYMDKTFNRVWQFHIDSPFGNAGNHTLEYFADMLLHILNFL